MPLRENLVVNNKDDRVFMSWSRIGLIVAPWKFDVLKTSILRYLPSKLCFSVKYLSNFCGATMLSSLIETLHCLLIEFESE